MHEAKVSAGHPERTRIRLEQDAFPWIGSRPIGEIEAPELLQALSRVEARGAIETAHRIKDACGQVFRYGIAVGACSRNPAADLRDALRPVQTGHHAAIIDPVQVGKLLRDMRDYQGNAVTRAALELSALLLLRPGELRHMEWAWVDLEGVRTDFVARLFSSILTETTELFIFEDMNSKQTHEPRMLDYPVTLTPDGDAVLVTFVDVPEAITSGADEEEALMMAVDALETALSFYVETRKPLPVASKAKRGQRTVCPSALEAVKLGVYQAMTEQGIKKAELARRLGWHTPQVDRLFDLHHASRLDQLEAAARALGLRLEIRIV